MNEDQNSAATRRTHAAYIEATGLSPIALQTLVVVMSFERCYGHSPTSRDVRKFIDAMPAWERVGNCHDLYLNELVRGLWLTADGQKNGSRRLTARVRAWQTFGFQRDELAAPERVA